MAFPKELEVIGIRLLPSEKKIYTIAIHSDRLPTSLAPGCSIADVAATTGVTRSGPCELSASARE
jgi:hypothetical protein